MHRLMGRCALALALPTATACLPTDTRPPPSRVLFTASASADTKAGALSRPTADGWSISFERVLVSLGRVSLDGPDCSVYSEARYGRVLSLIGAPDAQKISESYALGKCDFGFAIGNAAADSLLGEGTTAEDLAFVRTPGSDRYQHNRGISLFVSGSARRGSDKLTFAWAFRGRARYRECHAASADATATSLTLAQDGDVAPNVTVHAEALFAENPGDPDSPLRFDSIAAGDAFGGRDGEVTLEELALVPPNGVQTDPENSTSDAGPSPWGTFQDFIYGEAAPAIVRYEGTGECQVDLGDMRGGP